MTGNTQYHNIETTRFDSSTTQAHINWHSLALSTGTISSTSLATPSSTLSESPPIIHINDLSAGPQQSNASNSMTNSSSPLRIRHPSSELFSLLSTSKASSSSNTIDTLASTSVSEKKSSGLPLLAEVAQVAAAAVQVKAEERKRCNTKVLRCSEDIDDSGIPSKINGLTKRVNKGELEVRKDLTSPSTSSQRKSEDEINVFQCDTTPSNLLLDPPEEVRVTNNLYNIPNAEQPLVAIKSSSKTMKQRRKNCSECSMTFSTYHRLKQHIKHAHRKEETFSCQTCNESNIRGKENLKLHMYKSHGVGEIFRCEDCNFETSAKPTFAKHRLSAHPSEQDPETNNGSSVGGQFLPRVNQSIPSGCDRDLVNQETASERLSNPNNSILRTNKFTCKYCTRGFKSKAGLKLHLQQHTNEVMYSCMVCLFRTPQQQNLVKHLATKHKKGLDGEDLKANKECKLCEFKCVAEYQLKSHILRKHTDRSDMKYKCNDCGYASVEKSALVKHIRFRHTKVVSKYRISVVLYLSYVFKRINDITYYKFGNRNDRICARPAASVPTLNRL